MRRSAPTESWSHSAPRALASSLLRAGYRCDEPAKHPVPQQQTPETAQQDVSLPVERTRLRKTTFIHKGHIHVVE
jgi:hypothetical protein